jgi:hypothetical protein
VSEVISIVHSWQDLIAGGLAVLAAIGGALLLNGQIRQTEKHERSRLNRRFNAARATLPLTLSGLCAYATRMMGELSQVRSVFNFVGDDQMPPRFSPPLPPIELISSLQEMIEATNRENVVDIISEIIGEMQVLSGRVSLLNDETQMQNAVGLAQNVDEYMLQAARIYALASSLFEFARREDDIGPMSVSWADVLSGFNIMQIRDDQFPDLFGLIQRRSARRDNVWQYSNDR